MADPKSGKKNKNYPMDQNWYGGIPPFWTRFMKILRRISNQRAQRLSQIAFSPNRIISSLAKMDPLSRNTRIKGQIRNQ